MLGESQICHSFGENLPVVVYDEVREPRYDDPIGSFLEEEISHKVALFQTGPVQVRLGVLPFENPKIG